ncbi:MAG: hypothetical protein FWC70_07985, partial [Defluviitaleaceae bacterium]|nr:hypothetical protein [Defluviitaleaceae bacterium]
MQENRTDTITIAECIEKAFALLLNRCLVPCYNGANELPKENKKLWDKYYTDAPKRQRQPAEQYK